MEDTHVSDGPGVPALEAARAELKDIATNPQNPRYAGYQRGDSQVSAYLDGLYKKAVPVSAPVESGFSITSDFAGDAQAKADIEAMLRQEFGDSYDAVMRDMPTGAQVLFSGDEGQSALAVLSHRITGLGPKAEALGIKFLADLAKLQSQGGRL